MLAINGLQYNRRISAIYINTKDNCLSDALSRKQWEKFRRLGPQMDITHAKFLQTYGLSLRFGIMSNKPIFDIFAGQGKRKSTDNSSASSHLSLLDLQNIVDKLKLQRRRDSTRKNYYNIWKVFCQFLIRLDYCPDNWADRLTLFVGHLINEKRQSVTVKSYISAIKSILKDDDIEINQNQFLLSSLTKACKLQNDQIRTRLPIQKGMLSLIIEQIINYFSEIQNQPYLSLLYATLFSTIYFGLLRISEVTSELGSHPVLAKDVHVGMNKNKFLLVLRTSKTHWKNMKPQIIKISAKKLAKKKSM